MNLKCRGARHSQVAGTRGSHPVTLLHVAWTALGSGAGDGGGLYSAVYGLDIEYIDFQLWSITAEANTAGASLLRLLSTVLWQRL